MEMDFIKGTNNEQYTMDYLSRFEVLNNLNEKIIKLTNEEVVHSGYGDFCSGITIMLYDRTYDDILDIYKLVLKKHGLNLNNVYVTYLKKCNHDKINLAALKTEFETLGNSCFYLLHGFDIKYDKRTIVKVDYNKYIKILDDKLDGEEINHLKFEFYRTIEKSLKYLLYKREMGLC